MVILGIDPGKQGALVLIEGPKLLNFQVMPLNTAKDVCFDSICATLLEYRPDHIYLERAITRPIMSSKGAFTYGRDFAALEIAIKLSSIPVSYIEPSKWTKEMHEGINSKLKPKKKSEIAFERMFARFKDQIPEGTDGNKYHDGIVDAILIAAYGQRKLNATIAQ